MEEKRQDQRLPVLWAAEIILEERHYSCQIEDVSLAGVKIITEAPIVFGDEVIFLIPELGLFAAQVRFRSADFAGLAILGGPDLLLKKYAELSGEYPSTQPELPTKTGAW